MIARTDNNVTESFTGCTVGFNERHETREEKC